MSNMKAARIQVCSTTRAAHPQPIVLAAYLLILAVILARTFGVAQAYEYSALQSPATDSGTKDDLPETVVSALEANARAIATSTIQSVAEREYRKQPGKQAPTRIQREEILKYFDDGRLYHRGITTVLRRDGRTNQRTNEVSFDGDVFYMGTPITDRNSTLLKLMGDNPDGKGVDKTLVRAPYLKAAGYFVPQTPKEWKDKSLSALVLEYVRIGQIVDFSMKPESALVRIDIPDRVILAAKEKDLTKLMEEWQSTGTDPQFIDNEVAVIEHLKGLDPVRRVSFTLDPSKRFAVVHRSEATPDGRKILSVECKEHRFYPENGVWLPAQCTVLYFTIPETLANISETPYLTTIVRPTDISFKRHDDIEFVLNYDKPGTIIGDRSTLAARDSASGQIDFTVGADGATLRRAAESIANNKSSRTILIVANLVIFLILATVYVVLRKRSGSAHT